ncbi:YqaJ viral recombinase family protein [Nocardia sp. NPDC051570]|uniref:YqaJ viral recombinase family protein n=1 Tax=Nocardia sp. NPDC051570 TaxID=3364324 RepID=UPI003791C556
MGDLVTPLVNGHAETIGEFISGSPEWHAARANGIGGSEISAVVGLNPWESRFGLWHRKKDLLSAVPESAPMKWGTLLEPVIAAEYQANHLDRGQRASTGATYRHHQRRWQLANPDLLIWNGDELVDGVEIKAPGPDFSEKWGRDGSDLIPIYYRCQIAHYCDVMGLESMVLRALLGGNDARSYRIRPSGDDREFLRAEGEQFWSDFLTDVAPNLDGHLATYSVLRELHPDIDRSIIVDAPAVLADRWWEVQANRDAADAEYMEVRTQIADLIGMGWKARCGDQTLAYRVRPASGGDPYIKSAPRPGISHASITEAAAA